ncbi:MAG: DUF3179 domain-containing protein [Alphaproteobacteria bacterium]|nr:DUF3179 domain-containing protein [Alphaproteobacteria bacterium]
MRVNSLLRRGQHRFGLAFTVFAVAAVVFWYAFPGAFAQGVGTWQREFPLTDFQTRSIELSEINDDGNVRDSIPPVATPIYVGVDKASDIGPLEPVLSIGINGDFRAYPLRILLWHEIVNEEIGGVPVLISYCPLCNSGVVFDRRVDGQVLEFGNTGRLRHRDMVMYDKQTESWWQQFTGEAMIGSLTGKSMKILAARLESLEKFRARAPNGKVLIPENESARPYGASPYVGMDSRAMPRALARLNYPYELPDGVQPLERVVVVGEEAWTVAKLKDAKRIEADKLVLTWEAGQNSIHDTQLIFRGRDVGNVIVQRRTENGLEDVPYDVSFAFAFSAFVPDGMLHF